MKFHLPKKLLAAIMAAMIVGNVQAGYYSTGEIKNVASGTTEIVQPADIVQDIYAPYAKDGGGTLVMESSGEVKAPLYVREGELIVKNSAVVSLNPAAATNGNGATLLSVCGKDALMRIDGATVSAGREASIIIGGPDGTGTLVLDNKAQLNGTVSLFIGYSGYLNKPADSIGFVNGHASTALAGQATIEENRYQGQYVAADNGSDSMFGRGVVTVKGGSFIYTGYANLVVNHGELNIEEGSTVICGKHDWSYGAVFARQDNSSANINIKEGGSLIVEGDLNTAWAANSKVNILADGEGSSFVVADVDGNGKHDDYYIAYFGDNPELYNVTNVKVTNGATMKLAHAVMGADGGRGVVNVTIDSASEYTGKTLNVYHGTNLTNEGKVSVKEIVLHGGALDLNGSAAALSANSLTVESDAIIRFSEINADTPVLTLSGSFELEKGAIVELGLSELYNGEEISVAVANVNKDDFKVVEGVVLRHDSLLWDGTLSWDVQANVTYITGTLTKKDVISIESEDIVLDSDKSLGTDKPIVTTGSSSLGTAEGVTVILPGTIQNGGDLTISGSYDGSNLSEITTADTRVCVDGKEGNNGFYREGGTALVVVDNKGNATLTVDGETTVTNKNNEELKLYASGLAAGELNYGNYHLEDADHEAHMSEIQAMRPDSAAELTITLNDGKLFVDEDAENIQAKGGDIIVESSGSTPVAVGGSLEGDVSLQVVDGEAKITGEHSYTGATTISGENSKLIVGSDKALGQSDVLLAYGAVLDLGGKKVSNAITVEGCTIMGAENYAGDLTAVKDCNLEVIGDATANKITLKDNGAITGENILASAYEVASKATGSITANVATRNGGTITLSDGSILTVNGTLTLGEGTTFVLNGDYASGATLATADAVEGQTTGSVTLSSGYGTYTTNQGVVELSAVFNQNYADALTVSNWGIATASRAMVNAVRGQRSNTGCIADGKGTAWVAILGGNNDINGSDISLSGAALGADMQVGAASRVGVAMGYVEGEVRPSGLRQVDQEGSYIAAYGEHGLKKLSSTSCLSMDWVAAYGVTDSEGAGQKWEQDSVQLNSRVNWNKKVNDKLCMSVFGGLEYFANNSDTVNGVKTGSIQNLRGEIGVGARYVAWGTPAVTDGKSGLVLAKGCEKLVLNGEIRYMNDMVRSNPVIRMEGLSGMGENPGRQGIGIEAGATYRIGERWSASANYGFNTMEDSKEHRVNVGAAYTF